MVRAECGQQALFGLLEPEQRLVGPALGLQRGSQVVELGPGVERVAADGLLEELSGLAVPGFGGFGRPARSRVAPSLP
jgi:hypothetical protein